MTDDAALSGDAMVIADLCAKLAKAEVERELAQTLQMTAQASERAWQEKYERAEAERDALTDMQRVLCEEMVLAGYPGGDRNQTLANVRAIKAERDALRELLTELKYGIAQQFNRVEHGGFTTEWVYGTDIEKMIADAIARDEPEPSEFGPVTLTGQYKEAAEKAEAERDAWRAVYNAAVAWRNSDVEEDDQQLESDLVAAIDAAIAQEPKP